MPITISPVFKQATTEPVSASLVTGATTGVLGCVAGTAYATLKTYHAGYFGAFAGIQCFVLGSTFVYTRNGLLIAFAQKEQTRRQELLCSAAGGAVSGAVGGALRGRQNILPGATVMSVVGVLGQVGFTYGLRMMREKKTESKPLMQRLADSAWIPIKSLSDDEYETMLTEKLIRVEAEMSLIEDKISDLRRSGPTDTTTSTKAS